MYPRIESSRPGAFIMWEVHGVQCLVTTDNCTWLQCRVCGTLRNRKVPLSTDPAPPVKYEVDCRASRGARGPRPRTVLRLKAAERQRGPRAFAPAFASNQPTGLRSLRLMTPACPETRSRLSCLARPKSRSLPLSPSYSPLRIPYANSKLCPIFITVRFIRNQRGERLLLPTSHFASDFSVTMDARILRLKGKAYQKRRSLHPK